jgi:purine-nucleoside phosphorylase
LKRDKEALFHPLKLGDGPYTAEKKIMIEFQTVADAKNCLLELEKFQPEVGIVLGTGLGGLAKKIETQGRVSYSKIKGFPDSTVTSHASQLSWGMLAGKRVVAMEGRFHFYEGYSLDQITLPIRVMKALGVQTLVVSNAAGGMNPQYKAGDIVLIEDHINLMGVNPLIGPNDERLGPRFPDMIEPYSQKLLALGEKSALSRGIKTHRGVYVAVTGPNLETRAEYRFLRTIGADVVGMSTVPEVIVAVHAGMSVLGLSCVTDLCLPDALKPAHIEDIIATAMAAEPAMCNIVCDVLGEI